MRESYRRDKTYDWNYREGPVGDLGPEVRLEGREDFFGMSVAAPFGIAAGLLLNSRWIEAYARVGFPVLTYKTVRSAFRPAYPLPNWVRLAEPATPLSFDGDELLHVARDDEPSRSSAVCFGMPSKDPAEWREDVARARAAIGPGQVLIVSVVGTPRDDLGSRDDAAFESLVEDYARCARWAADAGAQIVEANLSCPNVCTSEGSIFQSARTSGVIASALRDALPSTPLFLKCGFFPDLADLEAFYRAVDRRADAVVLVNGVSRRVVGSDGHAAFGEYERVGVLGAAIRQLAIRNVAAATRLEREAGLRVRTIAVGGASEPEDIVRLLDLGARGVVLGGAPMFDSRLAERTLSRLAERPAS